MSDSPLEVGLGVSLDEGVDGAHAAVSLGGVVDRLWMVSGGRGSVSRSVPPHPQNGLCTWMVLVLCRFIYALKIFLFLYNTFEIIEKEHSAGGGADKSEKDSLQMENTLNYDKY